MGSTLSSSVVWRERRADDDRASTEDAEAPPADEPPPGPPPSACTVPIALDDGAEPPRRASADAAGYDLHAKTRTTLEADGRYVPVPTGVKLALGANPLFKESSHFVLYAEIRSRSGLAKKAVTAFHGTIDADYRGEVVVLLRNDGDVPFHVSVGDRIAQLVVKSAFVPDFIEYGDLIEFPSARGSGGFGSTGVGAQPVAQPVEGA